MDFLADNNVCGQSLLRLVARGNSIIAELKRLSSHVPPVFKLETKADQQKFAEVLLDFSYFKTPEAFTQKIENSEALSRSDAFVRERHLSVVSRIYAVFESVQRYGTQLNTFLQELKEGTFLHNCTDTVFADHDGRQLMCESLYLSGVMLLLLDRLYPGATRERLLVAHHRHAGTAARSGDANVDDVCRLLRSTGLKAGMRRPVGYPEEYFRRQALPDDFIEQVLGHLRTDDIYNQVSVYPSPAHRATAFSTQAAMLYVCLYFSPDTLLTNTHRMREIVDRFFPDNWVVSYYMGSTANIIEAWEPYKAARQALTNTTETSNVRRVASGYGSKLAALSARSNELSSEGALTEEKVLSESGQLLQVVRECNSCLRWLVLHCAVLQRAGGYGHKKCKAAREQVVSESQYSPEAVFSLLLHTAAFELKLTQHYKTILQGKSERWSSERETAASRLLELGEAFSEEASGRPLARLRPNARLHRWFRDTAEQVQALQDEEDQQATARRIVQLVHALTQVREYHDLSTCLGAVQAVEEACAGLHALLRLTAAGDGHTAVLATVSDLSYAWTLVDQYTPVMQRNIAAHPGDVSRLRAIFLKLSSGLELPLLRASQARSQDALSLSSFYSGQLVAYIRKVLQIIPRTMFGLLDNIVQLHTHNLHELPTRLDKDKMKEFAQLPQRYKLTELCHGVGVLAEGVSDMGRTLVGVLELQPRQLLEDGVRRELVQRLAMLLHDNLTFAPKKGSDSSELLEKLSYMSRLLEGFRSSFEYTQDYTGLYALKMWHEELSRVMADSVEQECALVQGETLPLLEESPQHPLVPRFPPCSAGHITFMSSLATELLRITDPRMVSYAMARGAWVSNTRQRATVADGGLVMAAVEAALTAAGLAGLDRLLAFQTVAGLQDVLRCVEGGCGSDAARDITAAVTAARNVVSGDLQRHFASLLSRYGRLASSALLASLQRVGQLQLLRLHSAHRLDAACSFQANHLHEALQALDSSLVTDMRRHDANPNHPHPDPGAHNPLSSQLSALLEWTGRTQPLHRLYVSPSERAAQVLPHALFLVLLTVLPKLHYVAALGSLMCVRPNDGVDGSVLCVSVATVLRQLPATATSTLLTMLAHYIAAQTLAASKSSGEGGAAPCTEATTAVCVLRQLTRLLALPPQHLEALLPGHLADVYS